MRLPPALLFASLLTACGPLPAPAPAAKVDEPACTLDQVDVENVSGRTERHALVITGVIRNDCDTPTGAQVKFTIYAKDGRVLTSRDLWPASVNNIPANSTFPFEIPLDRFEDADRYEVNVIAVKRR